MQTLDARGRDGSQQREVANGADVVFTDTVVIRHLIVCKYVGTV